jgi:hypothetical protein
VFARVFNPAEFPCLVANREGVSGAQYIFVLSVGGDTDEDFGRPSTRAFIRIYDAKATDTYISLKAVT